MKYECLCVKNMIVQSIIQIHVFMVKDDSHNCLAIKHFILEQEQNSFPSLTYIISRLAADEVIMPREYV